MSNIDDPQIKKLIENHIQENTKFESWAIQCIEAVDDPCEQHRVHVSLRFAPETIARLVAEGDPDPAEAETRRLWLDDDFKAVFTVQNGAVIQVD